MKSRLTAGIVLILLVVVSASVAILRQSASSPAEPMLSPPILDPDEEVAYVCPIHPDYTSAGGGTCPRDGMMLVQANPYDPRDYELEFETAPRVVRSGEPATLRFRVFHPGTGEQLKDFVTVHDRRYHLFVISQDMEYFKHLHPEQAPDGSWSTEVTLPKEGYYKLLSDFVPNGGSAQFIAQPLVTANYDGDLITAEARLVADTVRTQSIEDLTASISFDPETFVTGLYGHLKFELTETQTGRPVTDLQPHLGSFGHMLIMSEDLVQYVHSHPIDMENSDEETGPLTLMLPMGADGLRLRAGPEITFEGLMPKPGLYRAWTQFRRRNEVYTFTYTFAVEQPE